MLLERPQHCEIYSKKSDECSFTSLRKAMARSYEESWPAGNKRISCPPGTPTSRPNSRYGRWRYQSQESYSIRVRQLATLSRLTVLSFISQYP